jgi:LCP family protein required for cell wall assembly
MDGSGANRGASGSGAQDRGASASGKRGAVRTSPRKAFAKFFVVTFLCCVVGFTVGLGAVDGLLDQKPMMKPETVSGAEVVEPVGETEEKMSVLLPAKGVFKTDPDFKDSKRVNILLFGNTINGSETKGLTDTIMLGSFDPDTKKFDIVSVPRDTYYEREEYSYGGYLKINSVMETEGVKGACKSIQDVLQGVPINYYAVVNYDGIEKIIDEMDGVPMDVPFNMYYTDKKQGLYIDIKKGKQTLDGKHAVQFLRYRKGYTDGDIGRLEAQQKFVKAAVKEAIKLKNLPGMAQTVVDNIDSDIDVRAMLYLASGIKGLSSKSISSYMLPGEAGNVSGSKLSFWLPADKDEVIEMMREVYTGVSAKTDESATPSAARGLAAQDE